MFNTTNNSFNYNINAVSGTLRKSHPKSYFVVREVSNDTCLFNASKPTVLSKGREAVVLQVMLTGNNKCLIEFVYKDDFEEGA